MLYTNQLLDFLSDLFPPDSTEKNLVLIRTTRPAHFIILNLTTLIISGQEHKLCVPNDITNASILSFPLSFEQILHSASHYQSV
jgi:hypothetical protein